MFARGGEEREEMVEFEVTGSTAMWLCPKEVNGESEAKVSDSLSEVSVWMIVKVCS